MLRVVPEQEVLGLQVPVHNVLAVQVLDGAQHSPDNVGRVLLVVAAALTNPVKQLATDTHVGHEVQVVHRLKVVHKR